MKDTYLYFVTINENYLNYLKSFDKNIRDKSNRPYIGIVLKINGKEYFAPLSSPKEKYKNMNEQIDFFKLDKGKLGAINLNNMIPVIPHEKSREKINLGFLKKSNEKKDHEYYYLLKKQLKFCINNKNKLLYKAENLYKLFSREIEKMPKWQKRIYPRINNFKLLEFASREYEKMYIKKEKANEIQNEDQVYLINKAINKNWNPENILKISNIGINGFKKEEMESLEQSIEELDEKELAKYFREEFDGQQLISITDGLYDKLNKDEMNLLANPELDRWQMNEIRKGFDAGLSYEEVKSYAKSELDDKQMLEIRGELVEKKEKVVSKKANLKKKNKGKDFER